MLFQRYLSIFSITSLKHHIEYFHYQRKIQLNLPVQVNESIPLQESRFTIPVPGDFANLYEEPDQRGGGKEGSGRKESPLAFSDVN